MKIIKKGILLSTILFAFNASAIEKDKQKHFGVSTAIGAASTYFFDDYRYSLASCFAVGLGKELYDEYDYNGFSGKDLVYDGLGCSLGVLTGEVIKFNLTDNSAEITFNYKF